MKSQLVKIAGIHLIYCLVFSSAQLPLQGKPKVRGFPGKRHNGEDGITARREMEPMYRLNNTFIPSHYDLEVRVILEDDEYVGAQFTAPGKVKILGVNQETTSSITLHAKDLAINQSSVTVTSITNPGQLTDVLKFKEDNVTDFFTIELGSEINQGEEFEIYIEYIAKINVRDVGLFHRTYETEDGEIRRLAATQFQSVFARRMFPCFDEPSLKATFEMTVIRTENYTSLSNTVMIDSFPDPEYEGWVIDRYARTVKMSTYLVALVVSDFHFLQSYFGEKRTRIYAPKHVIEKGAASYSLQVAANCLSFYEKFFNETYKLAKMDSVAVPGFSGAMENYGLNIYGNSFLIYLPTDQSEADRTLITLIIAHELAHQWFGNLVTMKWWNEVYLNEGISTYTQYLGMEAASPDLMAAEYAILDAFQYSMLYDARSSTHPLSNNVSTPDEVEDMFSPISYEKGASIIRMIDGFLTQKTLVKGLQSYLKKMAYKAAEQDDLFDSLQEVASADGRLPDGLTMHKIMHTWTDQSGFPLVKVNIVNGTNVSFSQQRFKNHETPDMEGLWYIPISIVREGKPRPKNNLPEIWLENDGMAKNISYNASKWIMINNNATGFYRTLYDNALTELIQKQLELDPNVINPLSRSQLIDDYFILAKQKYINIQAALNLTRYLHKERHFTVWSAFFDHFTGIYEKFSSHPGFPVLQAYVQPKLDATLIAVGLEEQPDHKGANAVFRADLLDWSCSFRSPLCKEYALKLFAQWQSDPNASPITSVDAKGTLQCAMVASGGKIAFDFMFVKYRGTSDSDLREEFLNALACATDVDTLEDLLKKTLDPESGLVPSDAITVLRKVASNPVGRTIILKFVADNIDTIIGVIGDGHARPVGAVLGTLSSYYATQSHMDQIQSLVDTHLEKLTSINATIKAVNGVIRDNISWMDTVGSDIWTWLWFQSGIHNNKDAITMLFSDVS